MAKMKILYYIPNPRGIGADRWIYHGFRHAFTDMGHEMFPMTAFDRLAEKGREIRPDIFMTAINLIDFSRDVETFRAMRRDGTRVFVWVDWPLTNRCPDAGTILKNEDVADVYFGERELASIRQFQETTGRDYCVVPHAADSHYHYPTSPVAKYQYDVVYLGAKLPMKRWFFDHVLYPLRKKYRVGIFGPCWTLKDNILRAAQKICMKTKYRAGAEWLNDLRITVPPEEENALYSSAKVCLNFHERDPNGSQPHCILNERYYKIPACGGFQICDFIPEGRKYFSEEEVAMAKDARDWLDKVDYYIGHEAERKRIAARGAERAQREHMYGHRVAQILDLYSKCRGPR
jgi:spore maturation protein CgeB